MKWRISPIKVAPAPEPKCKNCRFYNSAGCYKPGGWPQGQCRRHAPTGNDRHGDAEWPMVTERNWCGEHQPVADEDGKG